ncbi:MIF4G domain-containing protein [Caenorhabditis elegans]|uniref:MIF4G domain-containing protein n=2 Tax=Caenorhabditis elegans TaxID=6239 RepID=A0A061AD62_CAEEL|nr:MIF4G domain-containing protein [Caenorhabditis elegans]CDR32798.1 MIF4G domain-containing protein [Caenorhabditis elegans]|eukprot:NP_001293311.1 Uncharacterized protein CELE_F32B5.6 [Caenorhabditis elegans]
MDDIAVPIASTSGEDSVISFQHPWTLKVCQRQIEDETILLNVSRPFSTSYKHVQFTWALRLTDEYVLSNNAAVDSNRHVLLHLYYKEGPCPEVAVEEVRAQILDPVTNETLFAGLALSPTEFSRGSGWPIHMEKERRAEFTELVHKKVDSNLLVVVEIKMKESLFEPLNYLPDVETAFRSQRIEKAVNKFVDDVINGKIRIPDLEHVDEKADKFSVHRLIFIYGVDSVSREISDNEQQSEICEQLVRNTFAHIYFERVLSREITYFDDFVTLVEGLTFAHLPALRKEVERFICQKVIEIQADMDPSFAKKLLLVSEKYNLEILKMVINGFLVDQIIGNSNPPKELVNITHELQQMAHEIRENENIENLVGAVVTDLQELTRRVRRVSLSHSPSQSSHSSSPLATPTNGSGSPSVPAPFDSPTSRFKRVSLA